MDWIDSWLRGHEEEYLTMEDMTKRTAEDFASCGVDCNSSRRFEATKNDKPLVRISAPLLMRNSQLGSSAHQAKFIHSEFPTIDSEASDSLG